MGIDSRITLGLALVYLLNGLSGLTGQSASFLPPVHLDFLLLALLSMVFTLVKPFRISHLFFAFLSILFVLQYLSVTGVITNVKAEITLWVLYIAFLMSGYLFTLYKNIQVVHFIPLILFVLTIVSGYFQFHPYLKLSFSLVAALIQLYILARPDWMEKTPVLNKRFYLICIITAFFDLIYMLFIHFNTEL